MSDHPKIDRAAYWAAAPKAEIVRAAEAFFGEPNQSLSSQSELRFGTNGSKAVEIVGDKAGAYCDHESNDSGYLRLTDDQFAGVTGRNGKPFVAAPPDPEAIAQREAEAEAQRAKKREAAMRHWRNAEGQSYAATEKYLTARLGALPIDLADDDSPIRENVTDNQETGTAMPTMIALITELDTGNPVAIHRTYLAEDGSGKADVQTAKKVLGPYRGCGVVFGPMKKSVVITEGIEDALTIALVAKKSTPIAAIAAGNIAALRLPDSVESVAICIDEDKAGRAAAAKAARKFFDEGKRVIVFRPEGAKDFNARLQDLMAAGADITTESLLGEPIIGDPDADPGDNAALLDFVDQHDPQAGISDNDDHGDGGDPLEGLIEAVADDPGAAIRPAVFAR